MREGGPVDADGRIGELDVIRGFALLGVLWMNLFEHAGWVFPEDRLIAVVPARVERVIGFLDGWLMQGKAQALFSLLFGFGFALFLSRADAAGRDGTRLYLRRVVFLLVLGFAHALLLWAGDILQAYAMMALLLLAARRWSDRLLLAVALPLVLAGGVAERLVWEYLIAAPGTPPLYATLMEAGVARRMAVFLGHDYPAYVRELWRQLLPELYLTPTGGTYLAQIFGRFLLGVWLFHRGWVQDSARHAAAFRRWTAILLPAGLGVTAIGPVLEMAGVRPTGEWQRIPFAILMRGGAMALALGYAAGLVVLCQRPAMRRWLAGLAAAGRMALSNYLTQSLLYFFLLYGFGAGLLLYMGPAVTLLLALGFFALQIAASRWWLARYRFGPAEWLWRSWTYGARQPMRRAARATGATATATARPG